MPQSPGTAQQAPQTAVQLVSSAKAIPASFSGRLLFDSRSSQCRRHHPVAHE